MKTRLHLTPAFGAALFCATAWSAVWLTAVRPRPLVPEVPPARPAATLRPALTTTSRTLTRPTRFSLPSELGFSGTFPESRIYMDPKLDRPPQPDFYLPREPVAKPTPEQIQFVEPVSLPQADQLSVPGTTQAATSSPQSGPVLFFSPELQLRVTGPMTLNAPGTLPASTRIQLRVTADGSVAQCFFETPAENSALDGAVRALRFQSAPAPTDGWMEIRFTPEGGI